MYQAIREIHQTFDRKGLKHKVEQKGDNWVLLSGMTGDGDTYIFLYIKTDDKGNDVAMRSLPLGRVSRSNYARAYELLNSFQQEFRFCKFVLDKDGDVIAQYDFPVAQPNLGEAAAELLERMTRILDKCMPRLKPYLQ